MADEKKETNKAPKLRGLGMARTSGSAANFVYKLSQVSITEEMGNEVKRLLGVTGHSQSSLIRRGIQFCLNNEESFVEFVRAGDSA